MLLLETKDQRAVQNDSVNHSGSGNELHSSSPALEMSRSVLLQTWWPKPMILSKAAVSFLASHLLRFILIVPVLVCQVIVCTTFRHVDGVELLMLCSTTVSSGFFSVLFLPRLNFQMQSLQTERSEMLVTNSLLCQTWVARSCNKWGL